MIDAIILKRSGRVIFDQPERADGTPARQPIATEIEIAIDQHFGIRIVQSQNWTTISFREAGEWSAPEDTRQAIRAALRK